MTNEQPETLQAEPVAEPVAEVIRARRFELVNAAGQVRGELYCTRSGNPCLSLRSADREVAVELCLIEDGRPGREDQVLPSVGFILGGMVRLAVGLEQDGSPSVDVIGADGRVSVSLGNPVAKR